MHFADKISSKRFRGLTSKTFPVLTVLFLLALQDALPQISDDFSDGNLTTDLSWSGSTNQFIVNTTRQLQLNAMAAGTSWLSTEFVADESTSLEWEFLIKQSFAPSAANFGRVYLMSDQPDVSGPLNGYFLQFGEAGANDAIELFRQTGTNISTVCRGTPTRIASAFQVRVKVIRRPGGSWELYADYTGGEAFLPEASGTDIVHKSSAYFGVLCTYTITNATRFFYDDFDIRKIVLPDTTPPELTAVEVTSSKSLKISFSEGIAVSAQDPPNYAVTPSAGEVVSAHLSDDAYAIVVAFEGDFANGEQSVLHIARVTDLSGNETTNIEVQFLYFQQYPVTFKAVIITEVLADPSPPVELPEVEFIELYNRGENPVDLSGWILSDATSSTALPYHILLPRHYVVLTSGSATEKFQAVPVLGVTGFPSLNNTGDLIIFNDSNGFNVDSVDYKISWYRDDEKADGGWSLELIDPENICADKANWTASESPIGGTPGRENSVNADMPDNTGPVIIAVIPVDSITIVASFDEKLQAVLPSIGEFELDPATLIAEVQFLDETHTALLISLSDEIQRGTTYTLTVRDVYDCPGNKIRKESSEVSFVMPEAAKPGDIIINEILFNPRPTGVDFIEVFNRSEKVIDLDSWSVRNAVSAGNALTLAPGNLLIYPGEFKVLTENANILTGEYVQGVEQNFFETDIPSLNDDEGSVAILDKRGVVIDSMIYTSKMHSAFIKDDEGVSLERISATVSDDNSSNWRSASSTSGYATPGYANSNARNGVAVGDGSITVDPEIIQPGIVNRDFAQISYHFHRTGLMANVRVYDQQGRTIRHIADNEMIGSEGFFRWEGDRDNAARAQTGYYMLHFEVFDADGWIRTFRKRVAVF